MASVTEKQAGAHTTEHIDTVEHVNSRHHNNLSTSKQAKVQSVALTDALAKDNLKHTAKSQWLLYGIILFATLNCCMNGYDGSIMGAVNAMDPWHEFFDVPEDGGPRLGLIMAIYNGGNVCGSFFAGLITDKFGRRMGMLVGAVFILVGSILQATSQQLPQFIGGRYLVGFGVPISVTAAPTYLVEMAYPSWRGIAGGLYNVLGWYIGSLTASWTCYAFLIPESPRWLMDRGHEAQAHKILTKYHGGGNPDSAVVTLELEEIRTSLGLEAELDRGAWWDYRPVFNNRPALYRMWIIMLISVFSQFTGGAVIAYYMPTILGIAGITSSNQQLLMNGLNNVFSFLSGLAGSFFVEKIGRRPMLLWGVFLTGLVYIPINVLAGLANGNIGKSEGYAFIAMLFLYGVFSSFTWSPLQALYPAEILNNDIRAKGMAAQSFIAGVAGFINMYATPVALRNIGWKTYTIFLILHVIHWFLMYFVTVETKGRSLEELEEIFNDPHPVKRSKIKTKVVVGVGVGVEAKIMEA